MAKYNLLEDDDLFDEDDLLPDEKNEDSSIADEPVESNDLDIDIDEDLLNVESPETISESTFDVNSDINIGAEEPEINIDESMSLDQPLDEAAAEDTEVPEYPEKDILLTDDFEDEKQDGINYKPIVLIGLGIIALILIYIGVDRFLLSGSSSGKTATEKVIANKTNPDTKAPKTAAAQKEKQLIKEKQAFLKNIKAKNQSKTKVAEDVLNAISGKAKLSSFLLYDQAILFEVFGKSRDDIAKANIKLKNQSSQNYFKVVSSSVRPGSGVLSVFKGTVAKASSSFPAEVSIANNAGSISLFENQLRTEAKNAGLKDKGIINHFKDEKSGFRRFEVDADFIGSLKSCTDFILGLGKNNQINIHKLRISAKDQKSFNTNKYTISINLEVFI